MLIIAGLGNPGKEYENTRHNAGFMVMDALAEKIGADISEKKHKALCGKGVIGGEKVILMKPQTYMNSSGESIRAAADYYKVDLATFITNYMGLTEEEYEKQTAESAAESAKEKLAIAAIAKKAGISLSDDDVKAAAETEYSDYGYDSADALLSAIGQGAYYDYVLSDKVNEYLIDQVTIVENDPISITETDSAAADTAEEDVEEELQEEESVSGEDAAVTDIAGTEIEAETEE